MHILIEKSETNGTAHREPTAFREGTYRVRLYTVPYDTQVNLRSHWDEIKDVTPDVLPGAVLTSFDPLSVESENETEQGVPSIEQLKLELDAVPQLQQLIS